jgi:hypothetical protein
MNYSSLVPVLNIVMITVLALIEVAPARIGLQRSGEEDVALVELPQEQKPAAEGVGRAADTVLLASSQDLGAHGYSSKLHLNSE